jgi:hypothetical protein
MPSNEEISSLLRQFDTIRKIATVTRNNLMEIGYSMGDYLEDVNGVIDTFNQAVNDFNLIVTDSKINLTIFPHISSEYHVGEARSRMLTIIVNCDKVIGFLERLEKPISLSDVQKLDSLKEQLNSISNEIKNIDYIRNLNSAILESENGHHLASALIASRVIVHMLDQIKGESIEEKVNFLKEKGIIKSNRKDTEQSIIKSAKLARNVFSHNIEIFPTPAESLSLLSDAITLLEKLSGVLKSFV